MYRYGKFTFACEDFFLSLLLLLPSPFHYVRLGFHIRGKEEPLFSRHEYMHGNWSDLLFDFAGSSCLSFWCILNK